MQHSIPACSKVVGVAIGAALLSATSLGTTQAGNWARQGALAAPPVAAVNPVGFGFGGYAYGGYPGYGYMPCGNPLPGGYALVAVPGWYGVGYGATMGAGFGCGPDCGPAAWAGYCGGPRCGWRGCAPVVCRPACAAPCEPAAMSCGPCCCGREHGCRRCLRRMCRMMARCCLVAMPVPMFDADCDWPVPGVHESTDAPCIDGAATDEAPAEAVPALAAPGDAALAEPVAPPADEPPTDEPVELRLDRVL